ncbi:MAG: GNAT family N-acetyltransferase [Acidobacteriota bacterium]
MSAYSLPFSLDASISMRLARPEEAEQLTAIAHAAKRHWKYPEAWIAAWKDDLTLTPRHLEELTVIVAEEESPSSLLGFLALRTAENGRPPAIEHLWLLPKAHGRGLGRKLFEIAVASIGEDASELRVLSDPNTVGFYLRLGFEPCGEEITAVCGERRVLPWLSLELPLPPAG